MDAETSAPKPMWAIALVGLSAFPISAIIYAYGPASWSGHALNVLLAWSAIMLGFLGGIRWGLETSLETPRWQRLAGSIISPIVGFGLIVARGDIPTSWIITGLMGAFIVQWLFDQTAPDVPARYPRLMTVLTLGASVSLAMALEQAMKL
ncbi:DUF3429 domain-containing protein [Phenylobacterium sp.]|uniref:DUF3429 domain-containing protein n=1 Tax=Phenylobacterium sp. TaxID=1871053 RepID=UPI00271CA7B5|nr:DUF3429 domain-containing protein [Phenylobacterium sp.]MDO8378073.1 DUF3429 domain-containing protein [Phenylobacterium sp.]